MATLFTGARYQVRYNRLDDTGLTIVVFHPWSDPPTLNGEFFAEEFLRRRGLNTIGIKSARNDWFQDPEIEAVIAVIRDATRGAHLVGYGGSMGGYAAINYSAAIGLAAVIAISPQFSPDPAKTPFETRWQPECTGPPFDNDCLASIPRLARGYVVFDPLTDDGRHAALITASHDLVRVPITFGGHQVLRSLNEANLTEPMLLDMITERFDRSDFLRRWRQQRRQSPEVWAHVAQLLQERGRPISARAAVEQAHGLLRSGTTATVAADLATRYAVCIDVHPDDYIYQFIRAGAADERSALEYYITDGRRSAELLEGLVATHLGVQGRRLTLLEFAAGYGCVSRHLRNFAGRYRAVACDIHARAIDFLRDSIGIEAEPSDSNPDRLVMEEKFDVVFVLSFFSHMPPTTWRRWLARLLDLVRDGGLLIFTTHGRVGAGQVGNPPMAPAGYWFAPVSEQKDLPGQEYGTMIVTPGYVFGQLASLSDARLRWFQEAFWWGVQDTYIVERVAAGVAAAPSAMPPEAGIPRYPHCDFPMLQARHLACARLFATRDDMVGALGIHHNGVVAEVGVGLGEFSLLLISKLQPTEFVAIDTFQLHTLPMLWGRPSIDVFGGRSHRDFYETAMAASPCHVTIDAGLSHERLERYPDRHFDLIYLDCDHTYEGVKRDSEVAKRKLRVDGVLVFNDYIMFDHLAGGAYGVVPVVNELVATEGWRVIGFALQQHMFCDIALRPPGDFRVEC